MTAVRPSLKRQQIIETTYDYFLREVDPIIGDCITNLLCSRPSNVPQAMLEYLNQKLRGETPSCQRETPPEKASKAQRLFLATQISPILTKLVNRIAKSRPINVIEFMCGELEVLLKDCNPGANYSQSVTVSDTTLAAPTTTAAAPAEQKPKAVPKAIQVIMLGVDGAGKTSFINALQGNFDLTKATIGFRPTPMMMGPDKVKFYDLGGGSRIRDIWTEYYHDVHGIVYVVDSTVRDGERAEESVRLFHSTLSNDFLNSKPILLLGNKQDKEGAMTAEEISAMYGTSAYPTLKVAVASCNPYATAMAENPEVEAAEDRVTDSRIEAALEGLLTTIQDSFDTLNAKVSADTKRRQEIDAQKRAERERRVLRNKIMCAFPKDVDPSVRTADTPTEPEDVFTRDESIAFMAAEIGVETESLCAEAIEVVDLLGYQRLAMQMVGALHAPISKKKTPMSWADIKGMVVGLRRELGLPDILPNQ
jgi:ADP-ribosylation factor-like protein 13B